jgi:hypothetical protein
MQYNECWLQESLEDFNRWQCNGIAITREAQQTRLQLAAAREQPLTCSDEAIDGGAATYAKEVGLCLGHDPLPTGGGQRWPHYNGGTFYFGTLRSPVVATHWAVNALILSWNATTPAGTWLQGHIRTLQRGRWTRWYALPVWAADLSTIWRHSIDGEQDATGSVSTDTYHTGAIPAAAYQVSLTLFTTQPKLSPQVRRIVVCASYNDAEVPRLYDKPEAWGQNLPVPRRSQMLPAYSGRDYGGGGQVWCSPTSVSMVLAYWSQVLGDPALDRAVPEVARDTYDFSYDGTGNWPFNTAYAASLGLRAFVTRMYALSQIERWISVGVPIVASLAWEENQLPGAPLARTEGHLVVVRGFSAQGDVIVNDPAAPDDESVERTYPRAAFEQRWLSSSHGVVYVIAPEAWPQPVRGRQGCW